MFLHAATAAAVLPDPAPQGPEEFPGALRPQAPEADLQVGVHDELLEGSLGVRRLPQARQEAAARPVDVDCEGRRPSALAGEERIQRR